MTRHRACPLATPARALLGAAAVAALGGMPSAWAQDTNSPYYIGLSQSVNHDSNLLRLGDQQVVPNGYSRADTALSTALLAGFDQSIGRQRLYSGLTVRNDRYSNNPVFNNRSYNVNIGLDWSTAERVSGSLSASANRSLQRFNNVGVSLATEKNLETTKTIGGSVSVGMITEYSLEASASHREVRESLDRPDVRALNYDQDNASLGLRWRPSSNGYVGLGVSLAQGRYPWFSTAASGEFAADRFKRQDLSLTASYMASGASRLDLRISNGKTRYDLNQARNFSGVTGNLAWNWQASGKLKLVTSLSRDTGQDSYATAVFGFPTSANYSRVINTVRVQADHQTTGKISLTTGLTYYRRSLARSIENPLLPLDAEDHERVTTFNFGVRWAPLRSTQLGCDLGNERRRAQDVLLPNMSSRTFNCYGQFVLQ
jgi:hypothetical protein